MKNTDNLDKSSLFKLVLHRTMRNIVKDKGNINCNHDQAVSGAYLLHRLHFNEFVSKKFFKFRTSTRYGCSKTHKTKFSELLNN